MGRQQKTRADIQQLKMFYLQTSTVHFMPGGVCCRCFLPRTGSPDPDVSPPISHMCLCTTGELMFDSNVTSSPLHADMYHLL
jgi:hypothetical protein